MISEKEALKRAESAIQAVGANAGEVYRTAFVETVREISVGTRFLSESLIDTCPVKPHDLRAAGPAIRHCQKLGLITRALDSNGSPAFAPARTSDLRPARLWERV